MKTTILSLILAVSALLMVGCDNNNNSVAVVDEIPEPPQGVYSVTGDGAVYVYFSGPYISDIDSYTIWRSYYPDSGYVKIGTVPAISNPNLDLLNYSYVDYSVVNGQTYFYAVASVDNAGQESDLSAETVMDTPRPEGVVTLYDNAYLPELSALIFGEPSIPTSDTNSFADFYIDSFNGLLYINAADIYTDIQDMGFTYSFDDIGYAPDTTVGWSDLGYFELLEGHTYVFWTRDDHYAKVRVEILTANSVTLQWAFQTDYQNPELVPSIGNEKPEHNANYLNKPIASVNQ